MASVSTGRRSERERVNRFRAGSTPLSLPYLANVIPENAAKNSVRNPGVNNIDLALAKRFPVRSEKRYFQLRWEAYNDFDHTQYWGINTAARYDLTTRQQVNALFGQVSSTRAPRVTQGSLRFSF